MDSYGHLILEAEKNNNLQKESASSSRTTASSDGKDTDNEIGYVYAGTSEQAKDELREILNGSLTYSSSDGGDWINRKGISSLKSEHTIYDYMVNPSPSEPTQSENVNHPSHYNTGKIEVIDFIEDQNLNFHLGNAVKYICRAGKKDPSKLKEDLDKAIWYIKRYKENLK